MSGQAFALLVGIDEYVPPVPALRGCRNDVEAMSAQLHALAADRVHEKRLLDGEATRENVIAAFRTQLSQAGEGDAAVFYYSGHGSREPAPEEFWAIEPDHQNETLVCVDSRTPGRHDLVDKELAGLVAEVSARGAHVLVVLDCCHSGSGVRGTETSAEQRIRQIPADTRPRSIETYAAGAHPASAPTRTRSGWSAPADGGRYVLLAACEAAQTAKEQRVGDRHRGVFTAALESALASSRGRITYADLVSWTSTRVRDLAVAQLPQLEATDPADARLTFLGGSVEPARYHRLARAAAGWTVDAGSAHGIPSPTPGEVTTFAVFPTDPGDHAQLATVAVTHVEPDRCLVTPLDGQLDDGVLYRAVIRDWPVPPLAVALSGDLAGVQLLRTAMAPDAGETAEVVEAPTADRAHELRVTASSDRFEIRRVADGRLLVDPVREVTAAGARRVVRQLERIAHWRRLRDLANPGSSLSAADLRLEVTDAAGGAQREQWGELTVSYGPDDTRPTIRIKVTNAGASRVYVAVLGLSDRFGVTTLLEGTWGEWLEPGESVQARGGKPIPMEVADPLHLAGVTDVVDIVKVIASSAAFSAEVLGQGELDAPTTRKAPEGLAAPHSRLDRLLRRVATRGFAAADDAPLADWVTASCAVRTRRPRAEVDVGANGVELGDGVTVTAPAGLSVRARIVDADAVTRETGGAPPTLLREGSIPVPLSRRREVGADSSVLELSWDADVSTVTAQAPILVRLPEAVAEEDSVAGFGYDGEFWLPLGRTLSRAADSVQVAIEQLPVPAAAAATKDLKGSVKLMFRKVVGAHVGMEVKGTRLAVASVDGTGRVSYDEDAVVARVAAAEKVLLYVHGILGDTKGMVRHGAASGLHDGYDVVLAFDYENITTPVRQTAQLLASALEAAGFGGSDSRRLDVVAHSMGGLVTRWFVEHEGGRELVDRVVLAGSPQGGSPWPKIQDWATTALGVGLNALAASGLWPSAVLGGLVRLIERVDDALDDMLPGSPFLHDLASLADPEIPYVVLAGDRSTMADPRTGSLLARLKLRAWNAVDAIAFLATPNDIAVTVASATAIPSGRSPAPVVTRVGCDHMTYFSNDSGAAALRAALTN